MLRGMSVSWQEEVIGIWRKLNKKEICSFHSETIRYRYEQIKAKQMCGTCRTQGTGKKCDESLSGKQKTRDLGVGQMIILK